MVLFERLIKYLGELDNGFYRHGSYVGSILIREQSFPMEISDDVLCLFTADVEEDDGSYVIEVPEREIDLGNVEAEEVFRFAVLGSGQTRNQPVKERKAESSPPVEEGEERAVEIENIGDQGDGIARVERGYVLIVPDTETGERVTVEVNDVRENVAFAEVVTRHDYYE